MDVLAKITGIKYSPLLCRILKTYDISDLAYALSKDGSFLLNIGKNKQFAVSWWVSPKRTRSYPYSRVYDTYGFPGKKITIIPIIKDEGKEGDRDFLQWDTISLMNLLGIYTIISYYSNAEKNSKYKDKITNQVFDIGHLKSEINRLLAYQSDALHWNLSQIDKVGDIGEKAINAYEKISKELGVQMHSLEKARERIKDLQKGKEYFMMLSRDLAKKAQNRESKTVQPKEKLSGVKATLTIKNYLGGYYFFTCDEVYIEKNTIYLIEGKHSKQSVIPSLEDIKDGLVKMILYTNLEEVKVEDMKYRPVSMLKLTSNREFSKTLLSESQVCLLQDLKKESEMNNFVVTINGKNFQNMDI